MGLLAVAGGGLGCAGQGRPHLDPRYGRAFHGALARQVANPEGAGPRPPTGLDTQEAQIGLEVYRKRLGGGEPADPSRAPQYLIVSSPEPAPRTTGAFGSGGASATAGSAGGYGSGGKGARR